MNHNENIRPEKHTQAEIAKKKYGREVLAILGVTAIIIGVGAFEKDHDKTPEKTKTYIVQPGDTEWGIAEKTWPNSDPRSRLSYIEDQLPDDTAHVGNQIQPEDKIQLPADSGLFSPDKTS